MNVKKLVTIILTASISVILLLLWLSGLISLWSEGISYVVRNATEYNTDGHIVEGEYSISIDLSNLESNIGKELYNDGTHRIYVSFINNTGSANSGGYMISFRSSGNYSLNNATLISGAHHAMIDGSSFTTIFTANMTAEYNGIVYDSPASGVSGINYKDGDEFGFYVFPNHSYKSNEITLYEKGIVVLTVKNLYKNIWNK